MGSIISGSVHGCSVEGELTRRHALRRLWGAAGAAFVASNCGVGGALAKPVDSNEEEGDLDPTDFLRGFFAAQQDRDLARLNASFVPGHEMLWVHRGRCHRGERAFLAWLTTIWAGSTWSVAPNLALNTASMIGRDGVCVACPVVYRYGDARQLYSEAFNVSVAVARTRRGPRISALIAAEVLPQRPPRFQ